jgi:hypothetical protein
VDEKYNLTGIIDWSGVTTAPQEVFASVPGLRRPPGIPVEGAEPYAFCLKIFIRALQERERVLVERGDWVVVSEFPGSDSAESLNKALEEGMPWRGVAYAKYLLPLVFGECVRWDEVLER